MDTLIGLLPPFIRNIPTHMDYEGQKLAERLFQVIIVVFSVIGFIVGYITQQFSHSMYTLFVGLAISCLLTLPPWPMYRSKPLKWQKPKDTEESKKTPKSKKKKDT